MDEYVDKYRVIMEFDGNGEPLKHINGKFDTSGAFIYCKAGKITVSRYDKNSLRIDVWDSTYEKVKGTIKDSGVKLIRAMPMNGESSFIVEEDEKNIHKLLRGLNAKPIKSQKIGIKDKIRNYSYWLRHCMRVSGGGNKKHQKRKLKKWNKSKIKG